MLSILFTSTYTPTSPLWTALPRYLFESHGVEPSDSLVFLLSMTGVATPGSAGKSFPFISNSGAGGVFEVTAATVDGAETPGWWWKCDEWWCPPWSTPLPPPMPPPPPPWPPRYPPPEWYPPRPLEYPPRPDDMSRPPRLSSERPPREAPRPLLPGPPLLLKIFKWPHERKGRLFIAAW